MTGIPTPCIFRPYLDVIHTENDPKTVRCYMFTALVFVDDAFTVLLTASLCPIPRCSSRDLNPSAAARTGSRDVVDPPNPAQGPLQSLEEVEESPSCENREGVGEGLTLPYRMLCETVSRPGKLDRHFLRYEVYS